MTPADLGSPRYWEKKEDGERVEEEGETVEDGELKKKRTNALAANNRDEDLGSSSKCQDSGSGRRCGRLLRKNSKKRKHE